MVSAEMVAALAECRRRTPRETWQQLEAKLADMDSIPDPDSARHVTAGLFNKDVAWFLSEAFTKHGNVKWSEIAVAMRTLDHLIGASSPLTEIIWTGPADGRFTIRRIDQVLYDLIAGAESRIMLVTFAAHHVPDLCNYLAQAVKRGVETTLIVESEVESEGQLTKDAVEAFRSIESTCIKIYYWPLGKRQRDQAGRPGKLHMKCAIVDGIALIGSANLTDDAFNRNMELGVLVREQSTVNALVEHFQELIRLGVLVKAPTTTSVYPIGPSNSASG